MASYGSDLRRSMLRTYLIVRRQTDGEIWRNGDVEVTRVRGRGGRHGNRTGTCRAGPGSPEYHHRAEPEHFSSKLRPVSPDTDGHGRPFGIPDRSDVEVVNSDAFSGFNLISTKNGAPTGTIVGTGTYVGTFFSFARFTTDLAITSGEVFGIEPVNGPDIVSDDYNTRLLRC